MALFFDAEWFDARLAERGLSREAMAAAAGSSAADLALVFKDQREISAGEVAIFAELLGVTLARTGRRAAGVSTPVPGEPAADGADRGAGAAGGGAGSGGRAAEAAARSRSWRRGPWARGGRGRRTIRSCCR